MRYFLLFGFVLITNLAALSQTSPDVLEISELKTPTSPAFTLLGVSPNEISRPKSMNDLELALTNGFSPNGKFSFPKEFAMETNPYWLFRKRPLSVKEWYNAKFGQQLLTNLSISLATAPRSNLLPSNSNQQLAFGFRTQLHPLFMAENRQRKKFIEARSEFAKKAWIANQLLSAFEYCLGKYTIDSIPSQLTQIQKRKMVFEWLQTGVIQISPFQTEEYNTERSLIKKSFKKIKPDVDSIHQELNTDEDILALGDSIYKLISMDLKTDLDWRGMVSRMRETYSGEHTFLIEIGTAFGMLFKDSLFNSGGVSRFGIWISPTYRTPTSSNGVLQGELIGMLRYLDDFVLPTTLEYNRSLDLGLRAVLRIQRFSFSGEALYRKNWQLQKGTQLIVDGVTYYSAPTQNQLLDWKASFNIEYRVTNTISVTYTFGRDFDTSILATGGRLMNLLGLNLGLFPALVKK